MANIGVVVLLTGSAILVDATGAQRQLNQGDSIQSGDTIIAPKGTTVELQLANGNTIQIAAQQTVTFTQELSDAILYNLVEPTDNAVSQATIQSLIQAIGTGDNIDDIIAALANERADVNEGVNVSQQQGHTFVDLLRIDNVLNQFDYNYDVASREYLDRDPLQQDRDIQPSDAQSGAVYLPRIDQDVNQFNFDYNRFNENFQGRRDNDNLRQANDLDYSNPSGKGNGNGNGGGANGGGNGGGGGSNRPPVAIPANFTGNEDAPSIAVILTGNDPDIGGSITAVTVTALPTAAQGVLQYQAVSGGPFIAVPVNTPLTPTQAASIQFIPASNFNGTFNIPFTVTDNSGATSPVANAAITVVAQNDAPVANNANISPIEDTPISVPLVGSDVDGTVQSYTITAGPTATQGRLVYDNDGDSATPPVAVPLNTLLSATQAATVRFVPAPNYTGPVNPISFIATDNNGANSTPATVTINPIVDLPEPTLSVSSPTVSESGFAVFTVSLSSITGVPVPLNLVLNNGTAIGAGGDYGTTGAGNLQVSTDGGTTWVDATTATIAPNTTSVLVRTPITNDLIDELDETFTLTATTSVGVTSNTSATGTATILDDDGPPTVTISNPSVVEGSLAVFTIALSNASTSNTNFTLSLSSGSATVGTDTASSLEFFDNVTATWLPVTGTLTIPAGQTSLQIRVATIDDSYADSNETFGLTANITSGNTTNATVSGTATITDEVPSDTTTVTLTADTSVAEGSNITYTATLTNPAQGAVTITLSNGAVITIANGATVGTVSFPAPTEDVYIDAGNVSATIASATGGNFENLAVNPAPAVTAITDTSDATTVTLSSATAGNAITEGGSIIYTATVSSAVTGSALLVTLSNGQTITIGVGQTTANSTPFNVRSDDAYTQGTQNLSVSINGTPTGGNFEALTTTGTVANTVVDDTDATTVTLTASAATVAEGATVTYTATVANAVTGTPLVITLDNGTTINIGVGQTSGTSAAVVVRPDDVYNQGTTSVVRSITGTTGGNYEALTTTSTVSTTVTEDSDATTLSIAGSATVVEGAQGTYTVTLTSPAQTNVIVNLTYSGTAANGSDFTGVASVTILAGQTTANFNIGVTNDVLAEGAESFTVAIGTVSGGNFENLVVSGTNNSVTTTIPINDQNPVATGTTNTGTEDAASITVVLDGTDADGTISTFAISALPANGLLYTDAALTTLAIASTNYTATANALTLYFKPNADWNGSTAFNFTATDNQGLVSAAATETITINAVNDAPVAVADTAAVSESGVNPGNTAFAGTPTATGNVLTNDTDVDTGDTKTVTAVNGVAGNVGATLTGTYGTINIASNGSYTYTLNNTDPDTQALAQGQAVNEVFAYTMRDTAGLVSTTNLTVNITGTNDAPTLDLDANDSSRALQTITSLFNTGVNASGNALIATGALDSHYTLISRPVGSTLTAIKSVDTAPYIIDDSVAGADGDFSGWIGDGSGGQPVGEYRYQTSFTLSAGQDLSSVLINFDLGADNYITNILVNGISTGITLNQTAGATNFNALTNIQLNAVNSTFLIGTNTITYVLYNGNSITDTASGANPTGLRVDNMVATVRATSLTGYTTSYTENAVGTPISDTDVVITDVDNANIQSATITLTNAQTGDLLASLGALPGGIVASVYNAGTGVITLSGSATLAQYQAAIRLIGFSNTTENPNTTLRTINVVVNDGSANSNTAVTTVNVIAVNDAPIGVTDTYTVIEGTVTALATVLTNDTDVDNTNAQLSVAQFATNNTGLGAQTVNGVITVTTALGGTVLMNANGTFTYTAPVRNHADAVSDTDSFAYRPNDGSVTATPWTTVNITIDDTNPIANADIDSVGVGGAIAGNVITGAGGVTADTLNVDSPFTLTNVTIAGAISNTLGAGNVRTIVTTNGTLAIDQDDGSYTYTSALQPKIVTNPTGVASFTSVGINVYGFDTAEPYTVAGNTGSLNLATLDATAAGRVRYDNVAATNTGIGVEQNNPGANNNNNKIQNGEQLVMDMGFNTKYASVNITDVANGNTVSWEAYNAAGTLLATGGAGSTTYATSGGVENLVISTTLAFRYIVIRTGNDIKVNGITTIPEPAALSDVFTYTLADSDGDTSSTTLTVNTTALTAAFNDVNNVFESGINGFGSQYPGTLAAQNTEIATGNLLANDSLAAGTNTIASVAGITPVAGVITITNAIGTLQVYTQAVGAFVAGDYVYTLNTRTTQGVNDTPTFNYVVTNSTTNTTTNANLIINVVDDVPVGNDINTTLTAASPVATYNLILVIDRSGSMAFDAAGLRVGDAGFDPTTVRMSIAKDALAQLIERFDGLGNVNVKIIDFSSDALETNWYIDDKANAISYIDNLQPAGGTQYSTALNELINGFTQPPADKTLIYFVTDGQPNAGYAVGDPSPPAGTALSQAAWETFVTGTGTAGSPSISFGIAIGSASLAAVQPIAFPTVDTNPADGQEDYAIRVANASDLAATLLSTVTGGVVVGNVSVLSGTGGASGFIMGADGGSFTAITVDGVSYTSGGNASTTILTNKGGELTINWVSATYTYQLTLNKTTVGQQEVFGITATDGDGDPIVRNLIVNLSYTPPLDANRDVILTNVAVGTPINVSAEALIHNDATTGSTAAITSTQNGINGTVTGTSAVVFTPTAAIPVTPIVVELEQLFSGAVYDNAQLPTNDIPNSAVDLTDRTRFGTLLPGGQAWVIDAAAGAGLTQVLSGRINATTDVDYVKVQLVAGETLYVDADNNNANITGSIQYYDAAGTLITPVLNLANVVGTGDINSGPNGSYTATQDGDYYIRLTGAATDYNLVLTIGNIRGGINEYGQFDNTLTEGAITNNATADIFNVAGNTIAGGEGDEIIIGGATNDILRCNGGNDVLQGNAGTDNLSGGAGVDRLEGGTGDDTLDGGIGNDILIGGANNDLLTGGAGSDLFVWKLADRGTIGAPAQDTINDFSTAAGVDKLDLRDLLVGEVSSGVGANLDDYLHFEAVAGGSTIVHISHNGAYSTGFNAANDVQTITLTGYDVTSFAGDQAAIIADLISKQKLITD